MLRRCTQTGRAIGSARERRDFGPADRLNASETRPPSSNVLLSTTYRISGRTSRASIKFNWTLATTSYHTTAIDTSFPLQTQRQPPHIANLLHNGRTH